MKVLKADKNILKENLENKKIVIVDFWAEWCGPCKSMLSILDEVAEELNEDTIILKIDVDSNNDIASEYGIRSIPTLIFFKDGKAEKTLIGINSKKQILETIKSL